MISDQSNELSFLAVYVLLSSVYKTKWKLSDSRSFLSCKLIQRHEHLLSSNPKSYLPWILSFRDYVTLQSETSAKSW